MPTIVNCPTCGAAVEWGPQSPWRPFCSQRCKLNDLGDWANERFRVEAQDSDETPPAPPLAHPSH